MSNAIVPSKDVDAHYHGSHASYIADQLDGVGCRNPIIILDEQNAEAILYANEDPR